MTEDQARKNLEDVHKRLGECLQLTRVQGDAFVERAIRNAKNVIEQLLVETLPHR